MSLGHEQEEFARDLGILIGWYYGQGYRVRMGDVFAHDGHKDNSQHYKKLAADLNLFLDEKFLTKTKDHVAGGTFWESIDPKNRWGGRYKDGNHYERIEGGWRGK